jgi:hypothetical protein
VFTLILGDLLWPIVNSLIALSERFSDCGSILAFLSIIEFISESIQILRFNHNINRISSLSLTTKSMLDTIDIRLALLETWVYHDLARIHIISLSVLANVGRSTDVAPDFISIDV